MLSWFWGDILGQEIAILYNILYDMILMSELLCTFKVLVCCPVRSHFTMSQGIYYLLLFSDGSMIKVLQVSFIFFPTCQSLYFNEP